MQSKHDTLKSAENYLSTNFQNNLFPIKDFSIDKVFEAAQNQSLSSIQIDETMDVEKEKAVLDQRVSQDNKVQDLN